jgi:hypothetical protein
MTKINFTGNIDDIKKQVEQTIATFELLGNRSSVNFEQWFEGWKNGFPEAIENRALGNYQLTGENAWRSDAGKRPRWLQWSNENGIIKGEYWKDRSNETDSIPLSGTAEQLIEHIIQLEYTGKGESQQQPTTSDVIRYSGIPEITLFFKGIDKNLPTKNQVITGEKSFRFVGYTDNPDVAQKRKDLELITQTDINQLGIKIRSIFKTSPAYIWAKGKDQVIYHDWNRGYNLNAYAINHNEGERLIAAILAIRNLQIDETFIKYSFAKNPAKAYPPSTEIEVLNQKQTVPERLPKADVKFEYAKLYLPTLKQSLIIA